MAGGDGFWQTAGGSSLDWVIVTDYGATGDGTTDDTTAIQAALDATPQGGVCYFPVPSSAYKITAALTIPHMMRVCGGGSYLGRYTQITQATANTSAFISSSTNGQHTVFEGLTIQGQTGGQTAGAAINTSQSVIVSRCLIYGFRDGLLVTVDNTGTDQAYYCDVDHSLFGNATRAGVRLVGIINNFTWLSCRADGNATGVQVVGGPFGLRFYGGTMENNTIGLDIDGNDTLTGQDTAGVIVSGTYFEQADGNTDIRIGNGTEVRSVRIEGCPFVKSGLSGTGWHILATKVDGLTITDCEFTSSDAVSVSSPATGVVYGRNHNMNAGTVTLPAGTIRLDASAVTPSNLDGTAAAAGTSHYLARADHEHGAVVVPGGLSATGTPDGTTYLRGDGTWATPSGGGSVTPEDVRDAGRWEVVVSGTAPPVATTNEAEDDWVYGWITG